MAENSIANLKRLLQRRTASFLAASNGHRSPLKPLIEKVARLGRGASLFGGTLRDIMHGGPRACPRDVDVVVAEMTPELLSYLEPHLRRRTRFGGVEVSLGGWDLDIWQLSETWAFREDMVCGKSFNDLPRTTFLNVQAVVAEIPSSTGAEIRLSEHGFFRAIRQRVLDINFEENPFPEHCLLAALTAAHSMRFALSPKLASYVVHYGNKADLKELCLHQVRRYGRVLFSQDALYAWISHLASRRKESRIEPISLPPAPTITARTSSSPSRPPAAATPPSPCGRS